MMSSACLRICSRSFSRASRSWERVERSRIISTVASSIHVRDILGEPLGSMDFRRSIRSAIGAFLKGGAAGFGQSKAVFRDQNDQTQVDKLASRVVGFAAAVI